MSDANINKEFYEFGKNIYVVAICYVLNFVIPLIPYIIMVIYMVNALGNIKRVNSYFNNQNLTKFRSNLIIAFSIKIATSIIALVVMIFLLSVLLSNLIYYYTDPYSILPIFMFFVMFIIVILIIGIVSAIIEMKAWESLNTFFTQNRNLFPEHIAQEAIKGTNNLKTANLCLALAFLLITGIIAIILQIVGYFNLSKLKELPGIHVQQPTYQSQALPPATEGFVKFCPSCGTRVTHEGGFCAVCGAQFD